MFYPPLYSRVNKQIVLCSKKGINFRSNQLKNKTSVTITRTSLCKKLQKQNRSLEAPFEHNLTLFHIGESDNYSIWRRG